MSKRYKKRYGALRILGEEKRGGTWHCICDCGNECHIARWQILHGKRTSCGCGMIRKRKMVETKWTHASIEKRCVGDVGIKNVSGVKGVYWHEKNHKWIASISHRRRRIYLGSFEDYSEAVAARIDAETRILREAKLLESIEERTKSPRS